VEALSAMGEDDLMARRMVRGLGIAGLGVCLLACGNKSTSEAAPAATSPPPPTVSAPATATAPVATVVEKKPARPCPDRSAGVGTLDDPCKATGKTRIMDVTAGKKVGDKGPTFKIVNNAKDQIQYGKIVVYFYDKAGKQMDLGGGDKPRRKLSCAGNIFGGPVKPAEKIFVNFSCVKKEDVPKGATTIEGEVQTVGFTDESGQIDSYWRNDDLVPDNRPKGGIK